MSLPLIEVLYLLFLTLPQARLYKMMRFFLTKLFESRFLVLENLLVSLYICYIERYIIEFIEFFVLEGAFKAHLFQLPDNDSD